MDADEQSDPPKSPVGREFESKCFGGDWVIAAVVLACGELLQALTIEMVFSLQWR